MLAHVGMQVHQRNMHRTGPMSVPNQEIYEQQWQLTLGNLSSAEGKQAAAGSEVAYAKGLHHVLTQQKAPIRQDFLELLPHLQPQTVLPKLCTLQLQ